MDQQDTDTPRLLSTGVPGLDSVLAGGLTAERLPLAARIAAVPQEIRGYGHVKDASVVKAKTEAAALWSQWEG